MSSQWPEDFLLVSLFLKAVRISSISSGSLRAGTCFKNLGSKGRSFCKAFLTKAHLKSELKHQGTGPRFLKDLFSLEGGVYIFGFVITWNML